MKELNAKKTYSRFGLTYSIGQLVYTVLVVILSLVLKKVNPEIFSSMAANILITYAVLVLITYPGMYLAIRNLEKTEIPKKSMGIGMLIACFPIAYTLGALSNLVGTIINIRIGAATGKGAVNPILDVMTGVPPVVMFLVAVVLAPICEELTFRKFLVDRTVRFGEKTAVLMSGLVFGLYHGNFSQFVYAFVLGAFFAYVYLRTGKIIYTILMHMFVNGISTVLAQVVTQGLDIEEMTGYIYGGDMEAYMNYCTEHAAAIAAVGLIGLFIILFLIAGVVLIAVNAKKVKFAAVPGELEKGNIFKNVIINVGMIVFILYCLANIVTAQLGLERSLVRFITSLISG
ncbi:CPBP family intramembrane metalloprotease [Butyrivibrio sp. DSM 10294]|uniref:CPBP family intramembrane glutamic endopeptidase n=1 Tax=Butyrivibrio sp. DSM 10294 TaxID=2972457 RepID=UPI00234F544D|nr:type II CAAX endopeptidase family protein [Butyrivibrio sp. DSM 10294]MDC7294899.1 CPBP family intramembrane metalloprotease [Butyrivibrio sp. DSM 10294]